jgi:hypothetical protein
MGLEDTITAPRRVMPAQQFMTLIGPPTKSPINRNPPQKMASIAPAFATHTRTGPPSARRPPPIKHRGQAGLHHSSAPCHARPAVHDLDWPTDIESHHHSSAPCHARPAVHDLDWPTDKKSHHHSSAPCHARPAVHDLDWDSQHRAVRTPHTRPAAYPARPPASGSSVAHVSISSTSHGLQLF